MKGSEYVGTSSNLWLDENAQCLSYIEFESLQTLKPVFLLMNCHVIFFNEKRAQNTGKKVISFCECAIIASLWKVEYKIEGLFKTY